MSDRVPSTGAEEASAVWCVACGYDVRGLAASQRCPECGQEVGPSIEHMRWLRDHARNLSALSFYAWVLAVALILSGIAGVLFFSGELRRYWIDHLWQVGWELLLWLPFIATVLCCLRFAALIRATLPGYGGTLAGLIWALLFLRFVVVFTLYWVIALGTAPHWLDNLLIGGGVALLVAWFSVDALVAVVVAGGIIPLLWRLRRRRLGALVFWAVVLFVARNGLFVTGFVTPLGSWVESVTDQVPEPVWISVGMVLVAAPLVALTAAAVAVGSASGRLVGRLRQTAS